MNADLDPIRAAAEALCINLPKFDSQAAALGLTVHTLVALATGVAACVETDSGMAPITAANAFMLGAITAVARRNTDAMPSRGSGYGRVERATRMVHERGSMAIIADHVEPSALERAESSALSWLLDEPPRRTAGPELEFRCRGLYQTGLAFGLALLGEPT